MTSTTMNVNCPWEITASAPCSMVSLILSCFSSLREICSDTPALLSGLETAIVTQDNDGRRIRKIQCRWSTVPPEKCSRDTYEERRMVLILKDAGGLYPLRD